MNNIQRCHDCKKKFIRDGGEPPQELNWKTVEKDGLPKTDYKNKYSIRCLVLTTLGNLNVRRFGFYANDWLPKISGYADDRFSAYAELE